LSGEVFQRIVDRREAEAGGGTPGAFEKFPGGGMILSAPDQIQDRATVGRQLRQGFRGGVHIHKLELF
jgi:hypothetical protein